MQLMNRAVKILLCACLAVWSASQSEGSLYPLQHDNETERSCCRKGSGRSRSLRSEELKHHLHTYLISTLYCSILSSSSPGEIRAGVCVAPLSRSSCWWRWLRFWVPALCSRAPPCGLCVYRRSSLCFRVVSQLQTLLSKIM